MTTTPWAPPAELDEYRIIRPLGQGGMGSVFLARDTLLDRLVAIKFISELVSDHAVRERFFVEARAAARLAHPNVVQTYRVGLFEGLPYLVSEFVRGQSLDELDKPVPEPKLLELALGLARGLAAAHERGVLHRDLKPANAMLADDGEVKLLDFGIAKLFDPHSSAREPPASIATAFGTTARTGPVRLGTTETAPSAQPAALADQTTLPVADPDATQLPGQRPLAPHELETLAPSSPPSLTKAGTLLGTPRYMAPEIWCGEAATRRSDIYSIGCVLYDLASGSPPHPNRLVSEIERAAIAGDPPPVASRAKDIDGRLAAVIDRCVRRDPSARFSSGAELRDALEGVRRGGRPAVVPGGNPYRGLERFEAEHRALFFGRNRDTAALLERLRTAPFVLVTGDSGVGKSSLCRAGVLPAAVEGALGGGRDWQVLTLCPGRHPEAMLRGALDGLVSATGGTPMPAGDERPTGSDLRELVAGLGRQLGKARGLVVFVDQLEELVTLAEPAEAQAVAEALAELVVGSPGLRLLATARSDFLSQLTTLDRLGNEISSAVYVLRPLRHDAIREAVVGPALAKGVHFESEALIESMVRAAGALPLLQFALAELWEVRDASQAVISAGALEALGGVEGALARHADGVLEALRSPERAAARRILTNLVSARGTRIPRSERELTGGDPDAARALDALVSGRLLVAREAEDRTTAFELAHEALLSSWATLRAWLDESAEGRAARERLEAAVAEWERLARSPDALWSTRRLEEAKLVPEGELDPRARAFLAASEQAVRRRQVRMALAVSLPLCGALIFGGFYLRGRLELSRQVTERIAVATSVYQQAQAHTNEADRLRSEAMKLFERGETESAERVWSRVRAAEVEAGRGYADAGRAFEFALQLDPTRRDLRQQFARFLAEGAVAAEHANRRTEHRDLLARLALYDDSNEWRRLLTPARVRVASRPAGAVVTIERYEAAEGGRRAPVALRTLTAMPVEEELEPGSYRLRLEALGRAQVLYPLLAGRGERLDLDIALPPAKAVPEGYVYVPPGRFLFGSEADDWPRRSFLDTVPLHEMHTEGYFIARNEVTYADWIAYLESLPPAERARRTPASEAKVGQSGALRLEERPEGGWRLVLQPMKRVYEARAGEKLVYGGRAQHAAQNWLKFPVTGISAEDAVAYAAWLDTSGRLPGARLCTDYEWERAARGADDREFPQGDKLGPEDANFDKTYGRENMGPDEVGRHPASRSPFGLDDMAGNAFECTRSAIDDKFVVRGGSFFHDDKTAQIVNRTAISATFREASIGARLCVSAKAVERD